MRTTRSLLYVGVSVGGVSLTETPWIETPQTETLLVI